MSSKLHYSDLNIEEINNQIIKLKKELLELKIKQKTKQDIKPHLLKNIKHRIAQMLTLKTLSKQKHL
uniref:Large ribosomal subunit protein uL29c n=1 Tax=Haraldiophyllum bonnemaisonii TaxID=167977 RepID=A0A4D6WUG6_9FLOR|nr:ribosomal protein L29 [Haraldiophyllum bonnemaisonii]